MLICELGHAVLRVSSLEKQAVYPYNLDDYV